MKSDWVITRSALAMQEVARDKADYHEERALWWEAEQEDAELQLREHGIDLREYQQTGGKRMQAVLDEDLATRLSECQYKVKLHRGQVQEYMAWVEFFKSMPDEQALEIHQSDFMYFDMAGLLRSE